MVTLYHYTNFISGGIIRRERRFKGISDVVYFSNVADGFYGRDYGPGMVTIKVPLSIVELDDSFAGGTEKFYVAKCMDILPEYFI